MSLVQGEDTLTEQQLISNVFKQITDIETAVDYCEPIEWYIRRYKLNGYDIEADEAQIIKTTVNKLN